MSFEQTDLRSTDTYSTVADDRSLAYTVVCLVTHVSLLTRYTTADIVLEIGSTSATVE